MKKSRAAQKGVFFKKLSKTTKNFYEFPVKLIRKRIYQALDGVRIELVLSVVWGLQA